MSGETRWAVPENLFDVDPRDVVNEIIIGRGISLKQLAADTGMEPSQLRGMIRRKDKMPTIANMQRVLRVLGLSLAVVNSDGEKVNFRREIPSVVKARKPKNDRMSDEELVAFLKKKV